MLVFWKTRYLNRVDRNFGDRSLYLDTRTLDAATRAAIELLVEMENMNHRGHRGSQRINRSSVTLCVLCGYSDFDRQEFFFHLPSAVKGKHI